MNKPYRLIWFQHFHKCAGTTIVEHAKMNNECFWPYHLNGNPTSQDGKELELWKYSTTELAEFIDICEKKGVSFVATEWGLPLIDCLSEDDRVTLITCIRRPIDRFVSNYYFDLHNGFTRAKSLYEYESSRGRTITMFNYYCRVLSGYQNSVGDIDRNLFCNVRQTIHKFDCCILLERGLFELKKCLSWEINELQCNKHDQSLRSLASLLLRGRIMLAYLRLMYPKKSPHDDFVQYFDKGNKWDLRLYDEICRTKHNLIL